MNTSDPHTKYVWLCGALVAAVLLPVLALNCLLGLRSLGGDAAVVHASQWQNTTRGVTYAPPLSANRPFKAARLFDRLQDINTVVFGSSTAMGITQDMFSGEMKIYNFSQTGNPLRTVIAEADFLWQRHPDTLKWFVIPLEWALGSLYHTGAPGKEALAPAAQDAPPQHAAVPVTQQLQDALSLPRVKNLFSIIANMARAPSPARAFREMFLQEAGDDYRCADGTPAKDFDTIFRGTCTGFRYDGSATFANLEPVTARRVAALIASAVVPSSKYAAELVRARGEPNPLLLERLALLAREMKRSGGGVILILPPLLPGMEKAFLNTAYTAAPLLRTKQMLDAWARTQDLNLIDAGQSERFGCVAAEFVDEHHALPACYARIFGRYWSARRAPGEIPATHHPTPITHGP